jgi:hypothetical protein
MFRYIGYLISLNNSKFGDYVDRIYLSELENNIAQIQLGFIPWSITWQRNIVTIEIISIFISWTFIAVFFSYDSIFNDERMSITYILTLQEI